MALNLMTTAQVAKRLSRDVRTIHRMVEDGRIEATTLDNGAKVFAADEVDRVAAEIAAELRAQLASVEAIGA